MFETVASKVCSPCNALLENPLAVCNGNRNKVSTQQSVCIRYWHHRYARLHSIPFHAWGYVMYTYAYLLQTCSLEMEILSDLSCQKVFSPRCAELQAKGRRQVSRPFVVLRNNVANARQHSHLSNKVGGLGLSCFLIVSFMFSFHLRKHWKNFSKKFPQMAHTSMLQLHIATTAEGGFVTTSQFGCFPGLGFIGKVYKTVSMLDDVIWFLQFLADSPGSSQMN